MKKGGLSDSKIHNLRIYTIKTPPMGPLGRISINTVFSWTQKSSFFINGKWIVGPLVQAIRFDK